MSGLSAAAFCRGMSATTINSAGGKVVSKKKKHNPKNQDSFNESFAVDPAPGRRGAEKSEQTVYF